MNMKEISYIDDILMMTKIIGKHRTKISRILRILAETDMKAKLAKCEFEKEEITFLGHRMD